MVGVEREGMLCEVIFFGFLNSCKLLSSPLPRFSCGSPDMSQNIQSIFEPVWYLSLLFSSFKLVRSAQL